MSDLRQRELAAIHCAKKDLGLDDETYRDLLQRVAGVRSAKDLDDRARHLVLEDMRARGAKKAKPGFPRRPPNMNVKPRLTKIEALLAEQQLAWAYADGIAKQMFRVDNIRFCDADQLKAVIAALVKRGLKVAREEALRRERLVADPEHEGGGP